MTHTYARGTTLAKAAGAFAVAAAAGALATGPAVATQPFTTATGAYVEVGHKVTICHRTGADDKYVVITVDVAALDGVGGTGSDHRHHEQVGNGPGGDIIPPFWIDGQYFEGKNWWNQWPAQMNGDQPSDYVTPSDCNPDEPPNGGS